MDKGSKQKMEINAMATDSLSRRGLVLPIRLGIDPMEKLLFRKWPATYRWRGVVELGAEPVMSGVWERKG